MLIKWNPIAESYTVTKKSIVYLYILNQKAIHKCIHEGKIIKPQSNVSFLKLFIQQSTHRYKYIYIRIEMYLKEILFSKPQKLFPLNIMILGNFYLYMIFLLFTLNTYIDIFIKEM